MALFQPYKYDVIYPGHNHLIYSNFGEPKHEVPSRPDNGDLSESQTYWKAQPLKSPLATSPRHIHCKPGQSNLISIQVMLDGKPDIVRKHVGDDGVIDWAGVAGENDNQHDHWPDAFGIVAIHKYHINTDLIVVRGHTVKYGGEFTPWKNSEHELIRDIHQFGPLDQVPTVRIYSEQGSGGGAHDGDTLGYLQFHDPVKKVPDTNSGIRTIHTTEGICRTWVVFQSIVEHYKSLEPDKPVPSPEYQAFLAFLFELGIDHTDMTEERLMELFQLWLNRGE